MISKNELPVAVIGAGPVGLAAAARLVARRLRPIVFEKCDACCVADAVAKVEGKSGCGCGPELGRAVRVTEGA